MYSRLQDGSFIIAGFVARDAEQKTTQNGKNYAIWSVAVGRKGQGDQVQTIWTSCKAWDKVAKIAAGIRKGDTVLCIGRTETNDYNGKTYKNLVCEYVSVMGRGASACEVPPNASQRAAEDPSISAEDDLSEFVELLSDDEVPF